MKDNNMDALRQILQSRAGQQTANSMRHMDAETMRQKMNGVDTEAAAHMLEQMHLGAAADKLRQTPKEDIIKAMTSNPALLEKLRGLF